VYFMDTFYRTCSCETEVRELRNCHNINVVRLDRIDKALKEQGIQ
jgi:hypothetical protein